MKYAAPNWVTLNMHWWYGDWQESRFVDGRPAFLVSGQGLVNVYREVSKIKLPNIVCLNTQKLEKIQKIKKFRK